MSPPFRLLLPASLLLVLIGGVPTPAAAQDTGGDPIEAAKTAYEAGDFDAVLKHLAPLLNAPDPTEPEPQLAREIAGSVHQRRGEDHFRNGRIKAAIADFDQVLAYFPGEEPGHWQRGIAYYYDEAYEKGVRQFELHQTVNPQDVENAVWHFLCAVRAPGGSVEKARSQFIRIQADRRVPLMEIHALYAGRGSVEKVMKAAGNAGPNARFYADLYIGLYHEALGDAEQALAFIARAAANPAARHYMGDVARVHLIVRNAESAAPTTPTPDP